MENIKIKSGYTYYAHHIPSGEDWHILGINIEKDEVCVSGWPPSIAKYSDCEKFEIAGTITPGELEYRNKKFGTNWI